jgi:hypothetical protein
LNWLQIILTVSGVHQANLFFTIFELILMPMFLNEFPIELNANNELNIFYPLTDNIDILQIIIFIVASNFRL